MGDRPAWLWVVLAALVALQLAGAAYFRWSRDWVAKERWFLPAAGLSTAMYLAWVLVGGYRRNFAVGLFWVGLSVAAIRHTRFCHRCGRTNVLRGNPRRRHCRDCGLDLKTQPTEAA